MLLSLFYTFETSEVSLFFAWKNIISWRIIPKLQELGCSTVASFTQEYKEHHLVLNISVAFKKRGIA